MPCASRTVTRPTGGRSQPVSSGEIRRTIQPLGAARKAKPTATATCGVASIGDTRALSLRKAGCCDNSAQNDKARPSDSSVATTPVCKLSCTEVSTPGWLNRARQASSDKPWPPMAGR